MCELASTAILWLATVGLGVVLGILVATEYFRRNDEPNTEMDEGTEAQIYQFPNKKAS